MAPRSELENPRLQETGRTVKRISCLGQVDGQVGTSRIETTETTAQSSIGNCELFRHLAEA